LQIAESDRPTLVSDLQHRSYVIQRSEEIGHQGRRMASIGGVRRAELGTHPPLLYAELGPIRKEDENDNDEPAHLGDGDRHSEESGENAGVDGVTDYGVGTGGDQLMVLLDGDGAAPVLAQVSARPDGEQKASDGNGNSDPERPIADRPELKVKSGQRDANR
jgi:hypothetical protein